MSQENVEDIRESIEAYSRGDYVAATAYLAQDVVWELGQEGPAHGPAQVQAAWKRWEAEWDEIQMVPEDFIDAGDHVVVAMRYRCRGRNSGVEVDAVEFEVHSFHQDRCVRKANYKDRTEALEAAGLSD